MFDQNAQNQARFAFEAQKAKQDQLNRNASAFAQAMQAKALQVDKVANRKFQMDQAKAAADRRNTEFAAVQKANADAAEQKELGSLQKLLAGQGLPFEGLGRNQLLDVVSTAAQNQREAAASQAKAETIQRYSRDRREALADVKAAWLIREEEPMDVETQEAWQKIYDQGHPNPYPDMAPDMAPGAGGSRVESRVPNPNHPRPGSSFVPVVQASRPPDTVQASRPTTDEEPAEASRVARLRAAANPNPNWPATASFVPVFQASRPPSTQTPLQRELQAIRDGVNAAQDPQPLPVAVPVSDGGRTRGELIARIQAAEAQRLEAQIQAEMQRQSAYDADQEYRWVNLPSGAQVDIGPRTPQPPPMSQSQMQIALAMQRQRDRDNARAQAEELQISAGNLPLF
jgi:hypothetical protein